MDLIRKSDVKALLNDLLAVNEEYFSDDWQSENDYLIEAVEDSLKETLSKVENIQTFDKWISVTEKLPDVDTLVIWYTENDGVIYHMMRREDRSWVALFTSWSHGIVTHWQPQLLAPSIN